jgi:hypothetical protein
MSDIGVFWAASSERRNVLIEYYSTRFWHRMFKVIRTAPSTSSQAAKPPFCTGEILASNLSWIDYSFWRHPLFWLVCRKWKLSTWIYITIYSWDTRYVSLSFSYRHYSPTVRYASLSFSCRHYSPTVRYASLSFSYSHYIPTVRYASLSFSYRHYSPAVYFELLAALSNSLNHIRWLFRK